MVLCVAAVITVLFHRLKQPPILGYLLAGILLGPHVKFFPFYAHDGTVQTLAELGVILVMFSIGLEFNARRLIGILPTAGLTTLIQISVMVWLGYTAGRLLGWTQLESIFTGAMISISSTMICAIALKEQNKEPKLTRLVFGVLILEDLAAVLMMALLTPMAQGSHLSLKGLLLTMGSLLAFLGVLLGLGFLLIPRAIRAVVSLRSTETLLVATVGLCFAMALLAQKGGYSVALGAFLAGMLVAESGATTTIDRLIHPLRDMFSAVFFVAVGMLVDPAVLLKHWGAVLLLTTVVVGGTITSVSVGAFLSGQPLRTALQAGMALSQIGEFSFIIIQVGTLTGAIRGHLYDIAVAVAIVTAFLTPLLVHASEPFSRFLDAKLPKPLQTFTTLYGSWVEKLKAGSQTETFWKKVRRMAGFLLLDAFLLVVIVITTAATLRHWMPQLKQMLPLPPDVLRVSLWSVGALFAIPFLGGVLRETRALGVLLAEAAIPAVPEGKLDLGLAPRRVLTLALQMAILLAIGFPLLASTQPFLPFGYSPGLLAIFVGIMGVIFWKRAVNLQGHVQAGAELLAQVISRAGQIQERHHEPTNVRMEPAQVPEQVVQMVPGIGAPTTVSIGKDCACVGKTLGELNLRSLTGASIIAVTRGEERHLMPSGKESLQAGDNLVLVGTQEAVTQAKALLEKKEGA